ncbi:hypothetical protein [Microvirga ossetica]|uniref:hypothetical protein n=1 Tax=Microvirga ossetica TaxID=1882682 RepID=UPI0012FFFFC2|nr:hypothetical protein [Microvirga ossetica]
MSSHELFHLIDDAANDLKSAQVERALQRLQDALRAMNESYAAEAEAEAGE